MAAFLDLLWFLFVDFGHVGFSVTIDAQKFVELRVKGLRIAMFRPLNKKRDAQRHKRGCPVPIK